MITYRCDKCGREVGVLCHRIDFRGNPKSVRCECGGKLEVKTVEVRKK